MTLYELTEDFLYLYNLLINDEIDNQTFSDSLEGMMFEDQLESKAEGYAKIIKSTKANSEVLKAEAKRLEARAKVMDNKSKLLTNKLHESMKLIDRDKIITPLFSISIQKNPESVVVDDIKALKVNMAFWKERKWDESELNKTEIKKLLQAGIAVPGARLIRGESLRIR